MQQRELMTNIWCNSMAGIVMSADNQLLSMDRLPIWESNRLLRRSDISICLKGAATSANVHCFPMSSIFTITKLFVVQKNTIIVAIVISIFLMLPLIHEGERGSGRGSEWAHQRYTEWVAIIRPFDGSFWLSLGYTSFQEYFSLLPLPLLTLSLSRSPSFWFLKATSNPDKQWLLLLAILCSSCWSEQSPSGISLHTSLNGHWNGHSGVAHLMFSLPLPPLPLSLSLFCGHLTVAFK